MTLISLEDAKAEVRKVVSDFKTRYDINYRLNSLPSIELEDEAEQAEPQKKMCANCKHIKKHSGKLADYVCDRKGSIVTNPYDKECDEMWEQTEPQTERRE